MRSHVEVALTDGVHDAVELLLNGGQRQQHLPRCGVSQPSLAYAGLQHRVDVIRGQILGMSVMTLGKEVFVPRLPAQALQILLESALKQRLPPNKIKQISEHDLADSE